MPVGIPIAFGQGEDKGLEELSGAVPLSVNVLADASKTVRKRPGIARWADFPEPLVASEVQAMDIFGQYVVYVTADRKLHAWLGPGLVQELSDGTAATMLDGSLRPQITNCRTFVAISGGGAMQYWDGALPLSARLPGNPPPSSHVVFQNRRLIVNPRAIVSQIQWSEAGLIAQNEDWTHGNFSETELGPGDVTSIWSSSGELVVMKSKSTMFYVADTSLDLTGNTVNAGYLVSRTLQVGAISPYGWTDDDTDFAFFDALKRILTCDGRSFKVISTPSMTKTLKALQTIDDCWATRINTDSWNLLVWVFPTEQIAFVYNTEGQTWSEWRGRGQSDWDDVPFTDYIYFPAQDLHLVGCTDGRIKLLDFDASSDDGAVLHAEMISGFIDHGSKKLKTNEGIRFTFRTTPGTTPQASLWWRDDQESWSDHIDFTVDEKNVVEFRSLGQYRTREWKLVLDDTVPMTLVACEEDFSICEM